MLCAFDYLALRGSGSLIDRRFGELDHRSPEKGGVAARNVWVSSVVEEWANSTGDLDDSERCYY